MEFSFEGRPSDSPFVEAIWRTRSEGTGSFISSAAFLWEMVVTKQQDGIRVTVRGPETWAKPAPVPENAEFFGIIFKLGTFMPLLPPGVLVNNDLHLPDVTNKSFILHGSKWELPNFENADTFVDRLVRNGLLIREPLVEAALKGHLREDLSLRSVQRRFLRATGLTHGTVYQIERAHRAAELLRQGVSIFDTIEIAGYADQPHLTRSLRRFIGQTPAQLARLSQLRLETAAIR